MEKLFYYVIVAVNNTGDDLMACFKSEVELKDDAETEAAVIELIRQLEWEVDNPRIKVRQIDFNKMPFLKAFNFESDSIH